MAIVVPDQGYVDLGQGRGSAIRPADTYARPAVPDVGGGLADLSKALANLGGQFSELGQEQGANAENLDRRRADYYANVLRPEIKDGVPVEVQLGKLRPEMSATVRALVSEGILQQRGKEWAQAEYEKLQTDPDTRLSPEKMAAWREKMLGDARTFAGNEVTGGAAYFRAVQAYIDQADNNAMNERTGLYNKVQEQKLVEDTINGGNAAYKANDFGFKRIADYQYPDRFKAVSSLFADKDPSHFENLNAEFGSRLEAMLENAPPEVKGQLKAISGFRSKERQAELFADAVKRYGSEDAARKWVAPPGGSNHNHGEAIDFDHGREFANTPAGKWVHENAEKYGLYFPMAHEPWHIEMVGGRRQGGTMVGSAGNDKLNDSDGPDNHNPVASVSAKIVGNPSVEGYGKNPNSSAQGVGQFTDGTWIAEVRRQDRETAKGKTDAQILALRDNPRYAATITQGFTQKNADSLKGSGLPVSESNLYIMHFAGEGDGPKIIKASDGTRLADVMNKASLEANPFLKGMSVGQFKQWASEKIGAPVGPISAARNSIRSLDQLYAQVGGLDNVRRRDVISAGLMKAAQDSLDTRYLQYMPPELMTPSVQLQFAQVERQVVASKRQLALQEDADKERARRQETEAGKDQITQRIAKGESINPADYASNSDLFEYASRFNKYQDSLIPVDKSKARALDFNDSIGRAAADGKWSRIDPAFTDGVTPTMSQLRQAILNDSQMNAETKSDLMGRIGSTLDTATFINSDENTQYFDKQLGDSIRIFQQNALAKFGQQWDGIDIYGPVRESYMSELRLQAKAAAEDGKDLKGEVKLKAIQAAEAKAKEKLKEIRESILSPGGESDKPGESKSGEKPGQTPAKPPAQQGVPDGFRRMFRNGKLVIERDPKAMNAEADVKDAQTLKPRTQVGPGRSAAPPPPKG